MVLSEDELKTVLKSLVRCTIDLNQGINYALNHDVKNANQNFSDVVNSLSNIIGKIND